MKSVTKLIEWVEQTWREWRRLISTIGADGMLAVAGLITGILTARLLMPEGRGVLAAVLLWPRLFASIGSLGVGNGIVYYAGRSQTDEVPLSSLGGNLLGLSVLQGAVIAAAGYVATPYILGDYPDAAVQMTRWLFLWAPFARIYAYAMDLLHGLGEFHLWNVIRVGRKCLYAGSIVLLWWLGWTTAENIVWGFLGAEAAGLVVVSGYLVGRLQQLSFDFGVLKELLSYGLRDLLANLAGKANHQMDQAIVSAWLSAESLGLYRVAVSGSKLLRPISAGFKKVLISDVSQAGSREEGDWMITRSLRAAVPALGLAALSAVVAMPFVVPLLFGSAYESATLSAQILCVAAGIMGVKQILYSGARGHGQPEIPLWCELVALIITGAGLVTLLPILGIEGAAITSLVAYGGGLAMAFHLIKPAIAEGNEPETTGSKKSEN